MNAGQPLLNTSTTDVVSMAPPRSIASSNATDDSDDDEELEDLNNSSFVGSFVMLAVTAWTFFTEIMVVTQVYFVVSKPYFIGGLFCFILPFTFGTCFAGGCATFLGLHGYVFRYKFMDYIPGISCLSLTTPICFKQGTDMAYFLSVILTLLVNFPQYIIDLVFLLYKGDRIALYNIQIVRWGTVYAPFWSILHLSTSFLILCAKPTVCYAMERYERTKSRFEHTTRTFGNVIDAYAMVFIPALSLELIYFYPILFEYLYFPQNRISRGEFTALLIVFNAPKLLFLGFASRECRGTGVEGYLYGPAYLAFPAVPWIATLVSKDKQDGRRNLLKYGFLAVYLVVSYVICGFILLGSVGFGNVTPLTLMLVVYQITCVLVIVPIGMYFGVPRLIKVDHEF